MRLSASWFRTAFLCVIPLLLSLGTLFARAEWGAPFLRYPAPSPDGRSLAFSYAGDIWTASVDGGAARRITVHEAYDSQPVWSPDGRQIAFMSARSGHPEVWVTDTLGAAPRRITFYGAAAMPTGWSGDGSEVYFVSRRDFHPGRIPTPYRVRVDGSGMPKKLLPVLSGMTGVSPDGSIIVYQRGYNPWYRKGYRGSGSLDLWLYETSSGEHRQLTGLDASEHTPMLAPDKRTLYYVSEQDGAANICRRALDAPPGSSGEPVTRFVEDGVRWAGMSADGGTIAFERGTGIFILRTDGGEPRPLRVNLPGDTRGNRVEWRTFSRDAKQFALSPDEKQAAVTVRGELFVVENEKEGVTRRISATVAREQDPAWMPDSVTLLFVSDSAGRRDIYAVNSADTARKELYRALEHRARRLTADEQDEYLPLPSPDGKTIAYVRGRGDLMLMDADGGNRRLLAAGWDTPSFSWSPDSRWIAFSRNDIEFNEDVWLIPTDGSSGPVNVSRHPDMDNEPVFSADGRKLAWLSRRHQRNVDIYFVFLRRADDEMSDEERRWRAERESREKKTGPPRVLIDFEDIHRRLRRVTSLPGDVGSMTLSPDGETFAFAVDIDGKRDLYTISWKGEDLTRITTGGVSPGGARFSADGKIVYFMRSGGMPSKVTLASRSVEALPLAARMDIDLAAERVQVFEEGWKTLDMYFYDPLFHGVDWRAMREKYLPPVLAGIPARQDFDDLVMLMLGELNASHLGISPPAEGAAPVPVGALGVRLDEEYDGPGFRVEHVFRGGPADRPESRLVPGDLILAVDAQAVPAGDNLFRLLQGRAEQPVRLAVRAPGARESREVVIRPISTAAESGLVYEDWVEERRRLTDSLSAGRVGYIHIQAMGWDSFEKFERDLYSECHDKDALLIDVRNNPGGWITDYLLAVLTVRRHARTVPRGSETGGYPQDRLPLYSWVKPTATLCNELSFSNAEIFSHAFKTLGLGPLVGRTTGGAVISTGAVELIDGSTFRVPFRGWYVEGSGVNMEKQGAVPDIDVPEPPDEHARGGDSQLAAAVRALLERLGR